MMNAWWIKYLNRKRIKCIHLKNAAIDAAIWHINRVRPDYTWVRYYDNKAFKYMDKIAKIDYEIQKRKGLIV